MLYFSFLKNFRVLPERYIQKPVKQDFFAKIVNGFQICLLWHALPARHVVNVSSNPAQSAALKCAQLIPET